MKDPTDLVVAMVAGVLSASCWCASQDAYQNGCCRCWSTIGLAVFVGIGVNKAFNAEAGPLIAVCMGVITGVGGGIIGDLLAREIPHDLRTRNSQLPVLSAVLSSTGLLHIFRTTGNSQYDGHGRDAIDSAGGY